MKLPWPVITIQNKPLSGQYILPSNHHSVQLLLTLYVSSGRTQNFPKLHELLSVEGESVLLALPVVSPVSSDPCGEWRLGKPWIQACCADRCGWLAALALQVLTTHSFIVFGSWRNDLQGAEHGARNKELPSMHRGNLKRFGFAP